MKIVFGCILSLGLMAGPASGALNPSGAFRVKGTVLDAAGQPIPGALVECYPFARNSLLGGQDAEPSSRLVATNGSFVLDVPPQSTVLAHKPGLAPAWRTYWGALADSEGQWILGQPGAIIGVVRDEAGHPVANAEVFATIASMETDEEGHSRGYGFITGDIVRSLFQARTTAEGKFRIEGFPTNAAASLAVRAAGRAMRIGESQVLAINGLPYRTGQDDICLTVEPGATVSGKIQSGVPGQTPPRARLTLMPQSGSFYGSAGSEPVESKPDGSFEIRDVPAGNYTLRASFSTNVLPDWVAEVVSLTTECGQTNAGITVSCSKGGVLEVIALGKKSRERLANVSITAFKNGYQDAVRTSMDGAALLRLPVGEYRLAANRDNTRSETASATIEEGKTNRVELEMPSPISIRGIVRSPDGQPAAGAELRIVGGYSGPGSAAKSAADGSFEVPFNPQHFGPRESVFCLLVRDPARNLAVAQDIDEETGPLDLRLAAGLTVAGRAEDQGRPITNATAALVFWSGNSGMHLYGLAGKTNVPGQFEIPALPPGRKYGLYVSAPGYGQKFVNNVEISDQPKRVEVEPVDLKPANLSLAGRVVDTADKPVSGASVNLSGDGQPNGSTTTDRQGRFTFKAVCEGPLRVFANGQDAQGNASAQGGETNVLITLGQSFSHGGSAARSHVLKGKVVDSAGAPVSGAQLTVFPGEPHWIKTAANGEFSTRWALQPWQQEQNNEPCLVVQEPIRHLAAAETIAAGVTNLEVKLKPAILLVGSVQAAGGGPLTNAEVGIFLMAGGTYGSMNSKPIRVNEQGTFEIPNLPPGPKYMVFASARNYGRSQQELELDADTNRVDLAAFALKPADRMVAGQVLDEKDKPASGVNVMLNGEDQPQESAVTDRQGRFKLKACEGVVQLHANSQSGFGNARTEGGDTNVILHLRDMMRSRYGLTPAGVPERASLKGKPLPDLSSFGLPPATSLAGKPTLVCLLDAEQRPSRRSARLLAEQNDALRQKGLQIFAVLTTPTSVETLQSWTNATPLPFPLGRLSEKTADNKWATAVESLPWLILCDSKGQVVAEGFPPDDLESKLKELSK